MHPPGNSVYRFGIRLQNDVHIFMSFWKCCEWMMSQNEQFVQIPPNKSDGECRFYWRGTGMRCGSWYRTNDNKWRDASPKTVPIYSPGTLRQSTRCATSIGTQRRISSLHARRHLFEKFLNFYGRNWKRSLFSIISSHSAFGIIIFQKLTGF